MSILTTSGDCCFGMFRAALPYLGAQATPVCLRRKLLEGDNGCVGSHVFRLPVLYLSAVSDARLPGVEAALMSTLLGLRTLACNCKYVDSLCTPTSLITLAVYAYAVKGFTPLKKTITDCY